MKNNIFTKSYIKKRLRDVGIIADNVIDEYKEDDSRYWSIKIKDTNDILICYRPTIEETFFKLITETDSKNIYTQSVNVIINTVLSK